MMHDRYHKNVTCGFFFLSQTIVAWQALLIVSTFHAHFIFCIVYHQKFKFAARYILKLDLKVFILKL